MFFNLLVRGTQVVVHSYQMLKRVLKTLLFSSLFIVLIITTIRIVLELNKNDMTLLYKYSLAKFYININKPNKLISISLNNNKNKPLTSNSSLSTINYQLSTPNNSSLSTINYQLSTPNNSSLSTINYQLSTFNYVVSAKQIVKDKYIITFINNRFKNIVLYNLIYCIRLYIYILTFILIIFLIKGYTSIKSNFIRGNKIVSPNVLNKIIRNRNGLCYTLFHRKQYKIANILTYPKGTESLHTIITGTTGTGKTVLLTNLIEQIRNKGDRAIIYDKMGTFTSRFYNPNKDIILNPLDDRSPYWSIFNEAKNTIDFETIAAALIPDTGSDPFFTQAARILFSSVASELFKRGCTSNKELTDKLLKTELKDSAELVKGTAAQAIIDENNPKTALSVMAVLSANLKSLLHLRETPNEVLNKKYLENDSLNESKVSSNENKIFSIRNWIQNDNQDGFLFLTSRADQHETLKPLISTWMDISINTLLSLEQSKDRNVWIIIDELPSLNYLPSLHSGLAESRQFGGRFVLALQLPAQLKSIYGDRKAEATSGLCGTRIILRTPDEDTATWCSNNLGKIETEEVKQSMSFASSESKDTVSLNKNTITKSIVSATEIMNLDNLNAYVKFAGDFPITKLTFKYKNYPKIAEKFIERKTNKIVDSGKLIVDSYEKLKVENGELKVKDFNELKTNSLSNEYINNYNDNNSNNNNNNQNSNYHHNKKKNENETATLQQQEPTIIKVKNIDNKNILSPELRAIRDNMIQEGKIIVEKSTAEEDNNDNKPSIINSQLLNCNNDITNDDKLSDDNIGDL